MRNWLGIGLAVGLVAGSLGTACSSTAVIPNADVATFCENKAKAECVVANTCLATSSACLSAREATCQAEATAAMATGTRSYFQPNAAACLAKVQQAYGTGNAVAFSDLFGTGSIDDLCNRVFQGNSANDKPCTNNYDCTNSEVCTPVAAGATTTVCGALTAVAAGGFCGEPGQQCATGTYCEQMPGAAATCVTRPGLNAACSDASAPCLETLRCVSGTCQARAAIGQPCNATRDPLDPNADCDPSVAPFCDTSDPAAGDVCAPGLSFGRGSYDCIAYGATTSAPIVDSGTGAADTAPADTGAAADTGSAGDAAHD